MLGCCGEQKEHLNMMWHVFVLVAVSKPRSVPAIDGWQIGGERSVKHHNQCRYLMAFGVLKLSPQKDNASGTSEQDRPDRQCEAD